MNEIKQITIEEQLLLEWKKEWPEYVINTSDDYPAIKSLVEKIGNHCKVEPSEVQGHERCCVGIRNLAKYCRVNLPWAGKNLFYINMCFQTLYNEMTAKRRLKIIKSQEYNWNKGK